MSPDQLRAEIDALLETRAEFWAGIHAMPTSAGQKPSPEGQPDIPDWRRTQGKISAAAGKKKRQWIASMLRDGRSAGEISRLTGASEADIEARRLTPTRAQPSWLVRNCLDGERDT